MNSFDACKCDIRMAAKQKLDEWDTVAYAAYVLAEKLMEERPQQEVKGKKKLWTEMCKIAFLYVEGNCKKILRWSSAVDQVWYR